MAKAKKQKLSLGTIAFLAIFVIAYLMAAYPITDISAILLLAILGAVVGIFNITGKEEMNFLIAITALNVIIVTWISTVSMVVMLKDFLSYLAVGFGVAGLIIALAVVIRLGSTK